MSSSKLDITLLKIAFKTPQTLTSVKVGDHNQEFTEYKETKKVDFPNDGLKLENIEQTEDEIEIKMNDGWSAKLKMTKDENLIKGRWLKIFNDQTEIGKIQVYV